MITNSKKLSTRYNVAKFMAKGLLSTRHPLLAHIVPMRRCNLACTYCNEFDAVSKPVSTEEMLARIDRLAYFGTGIVTISGGEPLMHPDLDRIISRIRHHGMISGLISNGYLMSPARIKKLNEAGLQYLQISIDNVIPDEVSKKSLKVLDKKLRHLRDHADFNININSVIGGGIKNPEDAIVIAKRAVELGFTSSMGIIHDGTGTLQALTDREMAVFEEHKKLGKRGYTRVNHFQDNLANGKPNNWSCRAGGRYIYICEEGLVHYCSQQRGYPAIPIREYTLEDIRREYDTKKSCAPLCTIACVQQVAVFDFWRDPQTLEGIGHPPRPRADENDGVIDGVTEMPM
ncbi:MAG: radical SAM protein [Blastocatellia bacterium]